MRELAEGAVASRPMGRSGGAWAKARWAVVEDHALAADDRVVLRLTRPRLPLAIDLLLVVAAWGEDRGRLLSVVLDGEALSSMEGLAAVRRLPPIATLLETTTEVLDAYGGPAEDADDLIARAIEAIGDPDRREELLDLVGEIVALGEIVAPARPSSWAAGQLGVHPTTMSRWMRERRERERRGGR